MTAPYDDGAPAPDPEEQELEPDERLLDDDELEARGRGPSSYRCCDCAWTGLGAEGYDHHAATGHAIRGANWSTHWPNMQFTGADADGRNRARVAASQLVALRETGKG